MQIIAAAIRFTLKRSDPRCPEIRPVIISQPRPSRHHDILNAVTQMHDTAALEAEQGFLADDGNFYGRHAAKAIVQDYGQPLIRESDALELFSEDLW